MIKVLIPTNKEFAIYEKQLERMYNNAKNKIGDTNSFLFIKNNTLFYCFLTDDDLLGAIYYFTDNGKLFLNAFANRKYLQEKIYCLKLSLSWFNCNVYAEAQNHASAFCLLKSGFKRVNDNLFIFKQE
ncbi:MAG: hypothetical protein MJ237_07435 [bacterium]|nr:hypothetical protein [bacterium]